MPHKQLILALSVISAASPALAALPEPTREAIAPAGTPDTKYCLRVEPITGSRIESVRCETRDQWARLEIDIDQEWTQNGVKVVG
jgi:hypothetical protein